MADSSPKIQLKLTNLRTGAPAANVVVVTAWEKNKYGALSEDYVGEIYYQIIQTTDQKGECTILPQALAEWHIQMTAVIVDPLYEATKINFFPSQSTHKQSPTPPDIQNSLSLEIALQTLPDKYHQSDFVSNSDSILLGTSPWQASVWHPQCYLSHEIHFIRGENFSHFNWFAWAKRTGRKMDLADIARNWSLAKNTDVTFVKNAVAEIDAFLAQP